MIENQTISLDSILKKTEGNIVSDMNGEKVMLSIENGKYYNLGEVGGDIWDCINSINTVSQIIDELTDKYEVGKSLCETQVFEFLEHLHKEQLIVL
jgi:hypothetical protein